MPSKSDAFAIDSASAGDRLVLADERLQALIDRVVGVAMAATGESDPRRIGVSVSFGALSAAWECRILAHALGFESSAPTLYEAVEAAAHTLEERVTRVSHATSCERDHRHRATSRAR